MKKFNFDVDFNWYCSPCQKVAKKKLRVNYLPNCKNLKLTNGSFIEDFS